MKNRADTDVIDNHYSLDENSTQNSEKKSIVSRMLQATWNWIKANKWGLLAAFLATAAVAGLVFGGIVYYPMALFMLEMIPHIGIGIAKLAFAANTINQAALIVASISAGFTAAAITSIWLFVGACKMVFHSLLGSGSVRPPAGGSGSSVVADGPSASQSSSLMKALHAQLVEPKSTTTMAANESDFLETQTTPAGTNGVSLGSNGASMYQPQPDPRQAELGHGCHDDAFASINSSELK